MSTRLKIIIIVIILAIVILLTILLTNNSNKVRIEVQVAPGESTVTLDGEQIEPGVISVEPGEHTLVASLQYFTDDTQTFNTNDFDEGKIFYLVPAANSPEAREWLAQNAQAASDIERIGGLRSAQQADIALQTYPFISELPFNALDYTVNYGFDENNQIIILVSIFLPAAVVEGTPQYDTQYERNKQRAIEWLRSIDVDVDNTNIEFTIQE